MAETRTVHLDARYVDLWQSRINKASISNHVKHNQSLPENRLIVQTLVGYKCICIPDILYISKEKIDGIDRFVIYMSVHDQVLVYGNVQVKAFTEYLDGLHFYQIDRNTIINLRYLDEIETKLRLCRLLKNKEYCELTISRSKLKEFKERYCMLR